MNEPTETRSQHLQWCKQRALAYVDAGDLPQAWASMASDMSKHPETSEHIALEMGTMMLLGGMLNSQKEMRDFIKGFN